MADHELPRAIRLSGSRAFAAVFQRGRRYGGRTLQMRACRNGLDVTRLGLAVRKGGDGAPSRNRTKRRIREAFRLTRPELPAGLDIVCMPTKWTAGATLEELQAELLELCAKADGDPKLLAAAPGTRNEERGTC